MVHNPKPREVGTCVGRGERVFPIIYISSSSSFHFELQVYFKGSTSTSTSTLESFSVIHSVQLPSRMTIDLFGILTHVGFFESVRGRIGMNQ